LTPAQEALLPQARNAWLAAGLSTEPADWHAAYLGIHAAYLAAGLAPPRFIIRVASPWAAVLAQAMAPEIITRHLAQVGDQVYAQVRAQVDDQVGTQVRDQVRAQVDAQVRAQVDDQVGAQVGAQVDDQVGAQVDDQVVDQVYDQVDDQVRAQVGAQVDAQVGDQVYDQVGVDRLRNWYGGRIAGQHWAGYYSYYYVMGQLGVTECHRMAGQMLTALSAGWWWCYQGFAVVSDRPAELHRDAQGRLHCADGMAVRYRDGWGFHAWHGVRIPAELCTGDLSLSRVISIGNSEVRRSVIEMTGWDKLESDLGEPVAVAADPGNPGRELALYDVPAGLYEERVRLVLMTNGSPDRSGAERRYGETVPATISDPVEAQAWAYGVPRSVYAALERRT